MLEKYGTVVSLGEDQRRPPPPAACFPLCVPAFFLLPKGQPCHPPGSPLCSSCTSLSPIPVLGLAPDLPQSQQVYRPPGQTHGRSRRPGPGHGAQEWTAEEPSSQVSAAPCDARGSPVLWRMGTCAAHTPGRGQLTFWCRSHWVGPLSFPQEVIARAIVRVHLAAPKHCCPVRARLGPLHQPHHH